MNNLKQIKSLIKVWDILSEVPEIKSGQEDLPALAIWSSTSNAKTHTVRQMAKELDRTLVEIFIPEVGDISDITGIPVPIVAEGKCMWLQDFHIDPSKKYILYLDEYNRGIESVMKVTWKMIYERRIKQTEFPRNTISILTLNPASEAYDVTPIEDEAKKCRMVEFGLKLSTDEWMDYESRRFDDIAFLTQVAIECPSEEMTIKKNASRRMLTFVQIINKYMDRLSDYIHQPLHDDQLFTSILIGAIGGESTGTILANMKSKKNHYRFEDFMEDHAKDPEAAFTKYNTQKKFDMYGSILDMARNIKKMDVKLMIETIKNTPLALRSVISKKFNTETLTDSKKNAAFLDAAIELPEFAQFIKKTNESPRVGSMRGGR